MAKITDPSKLLPSAKSSSIVKVGGSGKLKVANKKISLSKGLLAKRQVGDIVDINNKLVNIEKFLKNDLIISQKKAEEKRKEKEKQNFEEAEKRLETPQSKKFKLPGISLPSIGLFERIKRFLFFTALGWLVPSIVEFLPKLEGVARTISNIYSFGENLFGKLFDGFMSLVKFGGDLKDKTIGFIASAKAGVGGNYQTEFDKLEKQFNTFVNASIIAGVLSVDIGLSAVDEYNKWKSKSAGGSKLAGKMAFRDVGKELGERKAGYKDAARYRAKGQARAGGFALEQARKKATIPKPSKPPSWWNKIFKGPLAKLKGPLSKFAGVAVPGLGAVVGAADASARFSAGDKLGGTLASLSATLDALTAGSAILAITGVGAAVPAFFGTLSMSIDVFLLIRDILKAFNVPMFSRGGRVVRKYQGGGRTPARRTITPARKKPIKVKPPKSNPGKNVGGERKIKEFYYKGETGTNNIFSFLNSNSIEDKNKQSPYKVLTNTAKIFKDIPFGLGYLMGGAVDATLGEKMDVKKAVRQLSTGIGYIVENLANQKANTSISSLMNEIRGFAEGGYVPYSRQLKSDMSSLNTGDMLAKVLGPTIEQRVNEAIQSIQKQLRETIGEDGAGGGGGGLDGGLDDYDIPGAKLNEKKREADLLEYFTALYGKNAAIGIVSNLWRETGLRTRTGNQPGDTQEFQGMAQWTKDDRWPKFVKWAEKKGLDPWSLNAQAQYIAVELKQYGTDKRLKQAKSPEEAARLFYKEFERGAYADRYEGSPHEEKNLRFLRGVVQRNPEIGKRADEVLEKPKSSEIAKSLAEAAKNLKGMSTAAGPEGGNKACVWAVNQVFKKAGIRTPWGNSNYVPTAETAMINSGYTQIKSGEQKPGDLYIVAGQEHIGIVLPNGNIISNSSNGAKFSWEAPLSQYENYYGGKGKFYRMPAPPTKRRPADGIKQNQPKTFKMDLLDLMRSTNMKPSDLIKNKLKLGSKAKIVFPNIGSIQSGKNLFGNPELKYYDPQGNSISIEELDKRYLEDERQKSLKGPQRVSYGGNMQGGGLISPSKPNRTIPNSFTSYYNPSSGVMIAIQPIQTIVERSVKTSSGENSIIAFPVLVGVNNSNDLETYRG